MVRFSGFILIVLTTVILLSGCENNPDPAVVKGTTWDLSEDWYLSNVRVDLIDASLSSNGKVLKTVYSNSLGQYKLSYNTDEYGDAVAVVFTKSGYESYRYPRYDAFMLSAGDTKVINANMSKL